MHRLWLTIAALLTLCGGQAFAQGAVQQSGPVVPFHAAGWYANGVVVDAGAPTTPYLNSLGLFNGASCPFGVSSQTTPGTSTSAYSLFSICQTDSATTLSFTGVNGNPAPNVFFNVGGVNYPFPGPGNGTVLGPSTSIVSDVACFNNTTGTVLKDCGALPPQTTAYVSNAVGNGAVVGLDTNSCTSLAAPCLTLAHALGLVQTGGRIVGNGTFPLSNLVLSKPINLDSVNGPASFILTAASGATCVLESNPANGGVVSVKNLTIDASGSSAADICIDAGTSLQSVSVTGVTLISGTNVPTIDSANNASFNLTMTTVAQSGNGYGPNLVQMNAGAVTVTGLTSNLTPNSTASSYLSYDGGQGVAFAVDADGTGASSGSVQVGLTSSTINDILPVGSGFFFQVTAMNAVASFTSSTLTCATQPADSTTECDTWLVGVSQINPIVVPNLTMKGLTSTANAYGGGKSGPMVGFEGYPETCAANGSSQAGTTLTLGACLSTIPTIATGAAVTFHNNGGSNSTPTNETLTCSGTCPGGPGVYVGSISQNFYNTVLYINGIPWTGYQTGAALTISDTLAPANDTHAVTAGEQAVGGPNWSGAPEVFVTKIDATHWTMSQSQNLATGLIVVGAANMETTGLVEGNISHFPTVIKAHVMEGAIAFCGFASNITFHANYGDGADFAIDDKGCLNSKWVSNVGIMSGAPTTSIAAYGSTNFLFDHNTMIWPLNISGGGWRPGQPNDWWQTGYQYPTGTFSGNVQDLPIVQPPCNIVNGQAVTNLPGGTITPETIVSAGTGTGCAGTYNVSASQNWTGVSPVYINGVVYSTLQSGTVLTVRDTAGPFLVNAVNTCASVPLGQLGTTLAGTTYTGNDYFYLGGNPPLGSLWRIDTACTPSFTLLSTNSLATWQGTAEANAVQVDPQLINYTNISSNITNLNVRPASTSQIISGSSVPATGLPDFYLQPFDAATPTYGAAQFQMTFQGDAPGTVAMTGSQQNRGSTGTVYYMGASGVMAALDTDGTDIAAPAPISGYIASMQFTTSFKPGATNPGVVTATLLDNNVATAVTCIVPQAGNQCNYRQNGPPVFVQAGDNLTIKYCYTGDTTGATCTSYTSPTGRLTDTLTIRSQ